MAVNRINSIVFEKITKEMVFVVDTNILYFIYCPGYVENSPTKVAKYSNFIGELIENEYSLLVSAANIQELFMLIEKKEYELYCNLNNKSINKSDTNHFSFKNYRKLNEERKALKNKLENVFEQIKAVYNIYDFEIKKISLGNFISDFINNRYDPIDYFMVHNMLSIKHINFITDDSDFNVDSRINVYTY